MTAMTINVGAMKAQATQDFDLTRARSSCGHDTSAKVPRGRHGDGPALSETEGLD
jgi:hypothetical protein